MEQIENNKNHSLTQDNKNAMIGIYNKSIESNNKSLEFNENYLIQQLADIYYDIILENINESAEKGRYYCVVNFNIQYFEQYFEQYLKQLNKISIYNSTNMVITEKDFSEYIKTIVHKLFKHMSKPTLMINNENVAYLGDPLKYCIIPENLKLKDLTMYRAIYKPIYKKANKTNTKRKDLMIELRWGNIFQYKDYFTNVTADNITYSYNNKLGTVNKIYQSTNIKKCSENENDLITENGAAPLYVNTKSTVTPRYVNTKSTATPLYVNAIDCSNNAIDCSNIINTDNAAPNTEKNTSNTLYNNNIYYPLPSQTPNVEQSCNTQVFNIWSSASVN